MTIHCVQSLNSKLSTMRGLHFLQVSMRRGDLLCCTVLLNFTISGINFMYLSMRRGDLLCCTVPLNSTISGINFMYLRMRREISGRTFLCRNDTGSRTSSASSPGFCSNRVFLEIKSTHFRQIYLVFLNVSGVRLWKEIEY